MLNPVRDLYYPPVQRIPSQPLLLSKPSGFSLFVADASLSMLNLENDQILRSEIQNNEARYRDHMRNMRESIFGSPRKIRDYNFIDIVTYFPRTQSEKKLFQTKDVYYLVKKYFTEGVQHVNEGEKHVYDVIGRPLDFYIFNSPLESGTFRSYYDTIANVYGRIYPGCKKTFDPNTYYIIVSPCHTIFAKRVVPLSRAEDANSNEISCVLETVANNPSIAADEHVTGQERMISGTQPSTSQDSIYVTSNHSEELQRFSRPQLVNDMATRSSSNESNRALNEATTALRLHSPSQEEITTEPLPSNWEENETALIDTNRISNNINTHGAVFAIREDGDIDSYALMPGSTLRVVENDKVVGSFAISNNDMDPYRIDYVVQEQFIREVAKFKNGSTFAKTLTFPIHLLKELLQPAKGMEEVVVKYFFEFTFKSIKTAYEKFREMRRIPMIGSCVPAIIHLNKAEFRGVIPEVYEERL